MSTSAATTTLRVIEIPEVQKDKKGRDLELVYADGSGQIRYFVGELAKHPGTVLVEEFGGKVADEHLAAFQRTVPGWRHLGPVETVEELAVASRS